MGACEETTAAPSASWHPGSADPSHPRPGSMDGYGIAQHIRTHSNEIVQESCIQRYSACC